MDGLEHGVDGLGLGVGTQHPGLGVALGGEDGRLALAFGGEDLGLLGALGGQDGRTAITLGTHLLLHGVLDGQRRVDRLELHARDPQAPLAGGLVQHAAQLVVDGVAAGQGLLQVHPADHVAQSGGGQLLHGVDVVGDAVRGGLGVGDLEVDHGVDRDHQVVLGDDRLRREGDDLLAHVHQRQHAVNEGHHQGQACPLGALVLAEPFDHAGACLGHDPHGAGEDDPHHDGDDDEHDDDFHRHVPPAAGVPRVLAGVRCAGSDVSVPVQAVRPKSQSISGWAATRRVAPSTVSISAVLPAGMVWPSGARAVQISPSTLTKPVVAVVSSST